MTPLAALHRQMLAALIERDPSLQGTSWLDWIIVLTLARLFVDAKAEELVQAMAEGNPLLSQGDTAMAAAYFRCVVTAALAIAVEERSRIGGRG